MEKTYTSGQFGRRLFLLAFGALLFAMIIAFMPSAASAETWYNVDGTYSGKPTVSTVDSDSEGDWVCGHDLQAGSGDSITVDLSGGKEAPKKYTYAGKDGNDCIFVNGSEKLYVYFYSINDDRSKIDLGAYTKASEFVARITITDFVFKNTVSSISYEPSSITIDGESIAKDSFGKTVYEFDKRAHHTSGNKEWYSPFATGDKLIVNYTDGTSKTFINSDVKHTDSDGDAYYRDRFVNGDKHLRADINKYYINAGNNTVKISYHDCSTEINVFVKTKNSGNQSSAAGNAAAEAKAKSVRTVTVNTAAVTAKAVDAAVKTAGGSSEYVEKIVLGKKVKKISKGAFAKYKNVKTLTIKSKKLKKSTVKASLKKSKVKTVQVKVGNKKANKKFVKKYKKIFTKKNAGRKVTVK